MRFRNSNRQFGWIGRAAVALVALTAGPPIAAQTGGQPPVVTPSFTEQKWVSADQPIELRFSSGIAPGRVAVLIGQVDWTALFEVAPARLVRRPGLVALPAGSHEVVVYQITAGNEWQELGRFPLRVLAPGRLDHAEAAPALDIIGKGQVASGHGPAANAPQRDTFHDTTINLGGRFSVARNGWTTSGQMAIVGVTHRNDALQFATRAANAPLVDLSTYVVGARNEAVSFSLGHVTFGNNRHLATGFSSRGALATARLGPRADLTLAGLNGSSIIGWHNFAGVQNRSHRVFAGMLGIEAVPARPGALRVELSGLDGSLLPQSGVNDRRINDAEDSSGLGVRIVANALNERLTIDGGYSRSRFGNPVDPLLSQQLELVSVRTESRDARYFDVRYTLLRRTSAPRPLSLALGFKHELVEPLFRSVIGDLRADVHQNTAEVTGGVGPIAAQLTHTRAHDNLDDIASILRTNTRVTALTTSVPLARANAKWRPLATYQLNRTVQIGAGMPGNSDFLAPSQIPDQASTNHVFGFELQHAVFRAGYQFNRSFQDNRQPGRALSDLLNLTNTVSLAIQPNTTFDVALDVGFEGAENRELSQVDVTRRVGLAANWRPFSRTVVSGNVTTTGLRDEARTRDNRATELNLQLSRTIPLWKGGRDKPQGQLFIRYARQSSRLFEALFNTRDDRHLWTVNTGFNISLF